MPAQGHDPLRPGQLSDFKGQPDVSRELGIILKAAKARKEVPPHLLLSGPPGLGKTTLASIIANESSLPFVATSGPLLEKTGDLVSILANLTHPSVVFVDEVHRIPKAVEETLYTAMEDGKVDIIIGEGRTARTLTVQLEPFTLVGATTRSGDLGGPFRDRFGHISKLKPYSAEDLTAIVLRSAKLLHVDINEEAAHCIASRSRGTPRIANHYLRRVRDFQHSTQEEHAETEAAVIDEKTAQHALDAFGIDHAGLTAADREVLSILCQEFNGGPVGLDTLATAAGEVGATVAEMHEPYLMKLGFIARTPRGRIATAAAYTHLGIAPAQGVINQHNGPIPTGPLAAPGHSPIAETSDATLPGV